MKKADFLAAIKPQLKQMGYRKKGNYWYRLQNDLIFCVNLQGSQWDPEDYYVEIGAASRNSSVEYPSLLYWIFQHRCPGGNGGVNPLPEAVVACMEDVFSRLSKESDIPACLAQRNAVKVGQQYHF